MKQGQLFWGSLLVATGALFLLREYLPVHLTWSLIWNLWPAALILAGFAVLLRKHPLRIAVLVLAALLAAVLLFGMFSLVLYGEPDSESWVGFGNDGTSVPLRPEVTHAFLSMDVGAAQLHLGKGDGDLVTASSEHAGGTYLLESAEEGSSERVRFALEPRRRVWRPWISGHRADLRLNAGPEWELNLECGASSVDLDLRGLRVTALDIEAGAARVHVVMDALVPEARVDVESGVTSVRVEVPAEAGCEIRSRNALASRSFRGFTRVEKGVYRTENFETAGRRIFLRFETALSSLNVERY